MASVADTAARWADSDDPVSPELALIDPDLARRLRSRETARPAPPVRPPGAPSLLPVLAFQHELRLTAEPPPDPDAVRASFRAPPRPAPDDAPVGPVGGRELGRTRPPAVTAVQRPVRSRVIRALAVVIVVCAVLSALVAAGAYAFERLAAPGTPTTTASTSTSTSASTSTSTSTSTSASASSTITSPSAALPAIAPTPDSTRSGAGSPTHPSSPSRAPARLQPHLVDARPAARPPAGGSPAESSALEPVSLSWPSVEGATAYRFELVRGAERQFTSLAPTASFTVPLEWTSEGRPGRLRPGVYRWKVWPLDAAGRADDVPMIESQFRVG